jgi:hypothetical protein
MTYMYDPRMVWPAVSLKAWMMVFHSIAFRPNHVMFHLMEWMAVEYRYSCRTHKALKINLTFQEPAPERPLTIV